MKLKEIREMYPEGTQIVSLKWLAKVKCPMG